MADIFDADFLKGFQLGKAFYANLLRAAKGEPVAYLYNGVRLPKLPVTGLPYTYVTYIESSGLAFVYFSTVPLSVAHISSINTSTFYGTADGSVIGYVLSSSEWRQNESYSKDFVAGESVASNVTASLLWANTDVYSTSGSLYLEASDPVPVYE